MFLTKVIKAAIGVAIVSGTLLQARADNVTLDPTGTYIWTMPGRNGGPDRTNTLILKLDGANLTGQLMSPRRGGQTNITDIANGKLNGADISFIVVRTFNDNTITNQYSGTLTNNTITGKVEFTRDGDTQTRDWVAKKQ